MVGDTGLGGLFLARAAELRDDNAEPLGFQNRRESVDNGVKSCLLPLRRGCLAKANGKT